MIKNYFGPYRFPYVPIPGWMSGPELEWLYQRANEHRVIIEVGSAFGRSSHALLSGNFNAFRNDGRVYCVDPWPHFVKGTKDEFNPNRKDLDRRRQFFQNVGGFPNLNILEVTSYMASLLVGRIKPTMVFLDGGTANAAEDLRIWKSVFPEGLMCGHDYCYEYREVRECVDELIGCVENIPNTTIWSRCV